MIYTRALEDLIARLARFPGIGPKTAQRLAMHILRLPDEEVKEMAQSMLAVKKKVRRCSICFFVTETDPCAMCADERRDRSMLMVVEDSEDVAAIEHTGSYRGRYHVLSGVLSPLEGIGPQDLRIEELLARLRQGGVAEVILAVNPTQEGEATSLHLTRQIKPLGMKITRLARGIPVGGQLDQYDEVTLEKAINGRSPV